MCAFSLSPIVQLSSIPSWSLGRWLEYLVVSGSFALRAPFLGAFSKTGISRGIVDKFAGPNATVKFPVLIIG